MAFVAFIRNIDKEKRNELELEKKRKELEQSNKELEQFAYVTSHDLQEPLRKIQIFTDIIMDRFSEHLNEEIKSYLQKTSEAANRMTSLIRNLLDYSRLSPGTLVIEKIDLNEVLKDVEKDLEIIIKEKKATIQSDNLPIIEAIPLQIHQLFYNLVNNALKFSKKRVRPLLKINSKQLHLNELEPYPVLNKNKEYAMIEFQDNGIGFNQDYANKIFTIFQQLNARSSYSGYGIGLSICQKVVQNHKGIIFAKGIEQEGATFSIILPISNH